MLKNISRCIFVIPMLAIALTGCVDDSASDDPASVVSREMSEVMDNWCTCASDPKGEICTSESSKCFSSYEVCRSVKDSGESSIVQLADTYKKCQNKLSAEIRNKTESLFKCVLKPAKDFNTCIKAVSNCKKAALYKCGDDFESFDFSHCPGMPSDEDIEEIIEEIIEELGKCDK